MSRQGLLQPPFLVSQSSKFSSIDASSAKRIWAAADDIRMIVHSINPREVSSQLDI